MSIKYNITFRDFETLALIHRKGEVTRRDIAEALFMGVESIPILLLRMRQKGLIYKSERVGQRVYYKLTERGAEIIEQVREMVS